MGITIAYDNTFFETDEHNLFLTHQDLGKPSPKVKKVEIPLADSDIDVTTVLTNGKVPYNNRTVVYEFYHDQKPWQPYDELVGLDQLHGKRVTITDPWKKYGDTVMIIKGRLSVARSIDGTVGEKVVLTIDADPYIKLMEADPKTYGEDLPSNPFDLSVVGWEGKTEATLKFASQLAKEVTYLTEEGVRTISISRGAASINVQLRDLWIDNSSPNNFIQVTDTNGYVDILDISLTKVNIVPEYDEVI